MHYRCGLTPIFILGAATTRQLISTHLVNWFSDFTPTKTQNCAEHLQMLSGQGVGPAAVGKVLCKLLLTWNTQGFCISWWEYCQSSVVGMGSPVFGVFLFCVATFTVSQHGPNQLSPSISMTKLSTSAACAGRRKLSTRSHVASPSSSVGHLWACTRFLSLSSLAVLECSYRPWLRQIRPSD